MVRKGVMIKDVIHSQLTLTRKKHSFFPGLLAKKTGMRAETRDWRLLRGGITVGMKWVAFVFLLCLSLPASARASEWIIENGKAQAVIVVAEEPTRSAALGAKELQSYLEKITGARLEIVTELTEGDFLPIFVGESELAKAIGITAEGLPRDAFYVRSGENWLALVGNDFDFESREPWARNHNEWARSKQGEWEALAGHPWMNPLGAHLYRSHNRQLGAWTFDHRGSLNAVYSFLRELGVRWYMPGELGEIVPEAASIVLPEVNRTEEPEYEVRSVSRPLLSSNDLDDAMWYFRIGVNHQYGVLHHGQRHITEHPEQRKKNPDYYGQLADGTRDTERKTASACLSSEGFFNEILAFARLMIDHYGVPVVSVMPHDGFQHCLCDQCRPQMTPERGPSGTSSDYVWDFVVRVAEELEKTHPEGKIFCGAYNSYRLPPQNIETLPENVWMQITNGRPIREMSDEAHEEAARLRDEWATKTNNPLSLTLNYTPFTNRGAFRPQYWPHVAARGMAESHAGIWREDVWLSSGKGGLHHPGMSHLNPYVISRLWWDAEQDVEGLLAEYYELFYGPASGEMKAFIEYCELEYANLASDAEVSRKALDLFAKASEKVLPDSVYGQRIALVDEFLTSFRSRSSQMGISRPEGLPEYRIIDMGKDKWREARNTFTLDGKLEERFWKDYNHPRPLRDARSSRKPQGETRFQVRWMNDSLYLGVQCELPEGETNLPPEGESLELLIETDKHSFYQLRLRSDGELTDLDRGVDEKNWDDWSSQAQVATHAGDGFWSAEWKIPVTASEEDPLHQIVGSRPFRSRQKDIESGKGTSLPWYFNLVRKRSGEEGEVTTFSPLATDDNTVYNRIRFAEMYIQ